jgi:predicted metal-dependent phosphoesterase TrpH
MAAVAPVTRAGEELGITVIPGIEITSVHRGKDVHMLAYFLPESAPGLQEMLTNQRKQRVDRAMEIADRLAALGAPIDVQPFIDAASAPGGKAIARPQIAQALIAAGHVATVAEAFDRFLGEDSPAYVPHRGASPAEVVALVTSRGGIASLAHPGYRPQDEIIPGLVEAGMRAIEVFHSSHDSQGEAHYLAVAERHGLLVTGGSDYHGEGTRRAEFFGVTHLPAEHFARLTEFAASHVLSPSRVT